MPNKKAKERKRNRIKLNKWLSKNGRTDKQYKKKLEKKRHTPQPGQPGYGTYRP